MYSDVWQLRCLQSTGWLIPGIIALIRWFDWVQPTVKFQLVWRAELGCVAFALVGFGDVVACVELTLSGPWL